MATSERQLPKDDLCRAVAFAPTLTRAADNGDDGGDAVEMPTMTGRFAVFNQWTEINSIFEGRFLERMSPGAFKKTIREGRSGMRVLFQHGQDPQIADKPLGPIDDLREDSEGVYYEVPLLDTQYVRELLPGLEANLYGASFRFQVVREEIVDEPGVSDYNPMGLPERTVKEARVKEFGPVTFPAYEGASAGVRSLTDEFIFARFAGAAADPERLEQLVEFARALRGDNIDPAAAERMAEAANDLPGDDAGDDLPPSDSAADAGTEDESRDQQDPTEQDDVPQAPTLTVTPRRSYLTMKTIGKDEPWRLS